MDAHPSRAAALPGEGWEPFSDGTFLEHMGNVFLRRQGDMIEVALCSTPKHRNLGGYVHGGVTMTLLDRAMGINVRNSVGLGTPTAAMTVNFLRGIRIGEVVIATCQLRRISKSAVFAEAEATVDGTPVATASGTFIRSGKSHAAAAHQ